MPDAVPPEAIARIRAASAATGVALAALSGTYNMAHPDPAVRADGLRRLGVVIAAAAALAIPLVTLCTGTRHPEDQWAITRTTPTPRPGPTWRRRSPRRWTSPSATASISASSPSRPTS